VRLRSIEHPADRSTAVRATTFVAQNAGALHTRHVPLHAPAECPTTPEPKKGSRRAKHVRETPLPESGRTSRPALHMSRGARAGIASIATRIDTPQAKISANQTIVDHPRPSRAEGVRRRFWRSWRAGWHRFPRSGRKHPQQEFLTGRQHNILYCGGAFSGLEMINPRAGPSTSIAMAAQVAARRSRTGKYSVTSPEDLLKYGIFRSRRPSACRSRRWKLSMRPR